MVQQKYRNHSHTGQNWITEYVAHTDKVKYDFISQYSNTNGDTVTVSQWIGLIQLS